MTKRLEASTDRYAHLRANAASQRQLTIDRLTLAIATLEADQRPVNTFTIKEISGMDYMTYYRNPEALALFRTHSTHLREERVKKQKRRGSKKSSTKQDESLHHVKVEVRDPLLNYKKPELVVKLRAAQTECEQVKEQAQAGRVELEQCYSTLLQEHMQCSVTIAKLQAQQAEFQAFLQRFRSALKDEEYGTSS